MPGDITTWGFRIAYAGAAPGGGDAILACHGAYEKVAGTHSDHSQFTDPRVGYTPAPAKRYTTVPATIGMLYLWAVEGRYGVSGQNTLLNMMSVESPFDAQFQQTHAVPDIVPGNGRVIDYQLTYQISTKVIAKNAGGKLAEFFPGRVQRHDLITVQSERRERTLSSLWTALKGVRYDVLHCCFCRVPRTLADRPQVRIA